MEIYETEEEQVEALKRWWKENGQATITGVIVGVALILGWNFWQSYKRDQTLQASALYEQLLTAADEGKADSAEKIADRINEQYESVAYSTYAALIKAKIKVQQNDLAAAKQILEATAASADQELSHVARLRLIRILLAQGEYEKGLQLIAEVDPGSMTGFAGAYEELRGDLYVALDSLGEARTAYQSALRSGHQSPLLQLKIDDLAEAEIISSTK
ncbi:MAG: YfgM family protein [Gammaproteobacteria bacterium]